MLCREKQRKTRVELALALLSISILAGPANCAPTADAKIAPEQAKLKRAQSVAADKSRIQPQSAATATTQQPRPKPITSEGKAKSQPSGKNTDSVKGNLHPNSLDSSKKVGSADSTKKEASKSSATESIDKAADRYRQLNNAASNNDRISRKPRSQRNTLIPPPPPTMPTYLNVPTSGFEGGFSVQLMSLDDLKFQLKNVEKRLAAANEDEQDQIRVAKEKGERATRFDELYEEGVVSRRELEQSHEDAERAKRDLEQAHIKVEENSRLIAQVKERISALEPKNKQSKISVQKKNSPSKKARKQTSAKSAPQEQISR